jgi:hypothetical protein
MSSNFSPHIGKNVIETLTLGMYDDPRFIFREYIQNSADQIDIAVEAKVLPSRDDGRIIVNIDVADKRICIVDNATGISTTKIEKFLGDVANSDKDPGKRKGFRGIGRLGGLGYCAKLIFETSFLGESVKSIMTLDAGLLKKIIQDRSDNSDASAVISLITSINQQQEDTESHYFKVILENVRNEKLLNIESVEKYLSMNCPLPFNGTFDFAFDIKNYFERNNVILDEYNVVLNDVPIFKAYKNSFVIKTIRILN